MRWKGNESFWKGYCTSAKCEEQKSSDVKRHEKGKFGTLAKNYRIVEINN